MRHSSTCFRGSRTEADSPAAEDIAFAESRIRAETVAAEDVLQDDGAISIISSDSQAMGRIGEVVSRTWRTASKMKEFRGPLKEEKREGVDNERVKVCPVFLGRWTLSASSIKPQVLTERHLPHLAALRRKVHYQPGDHVRNVGNPRRRGGRQARGPSPVVACKLWSATRDGHQGRHHCMGECESWCRDPPLRDQALTRAQNPALQMGDANGVSHPSLSPLANAFRA